MSKQIASPSKRWPGSITLRYPVPIEPYTVWKRCIEEVAALKAQSATDADADDVALLRLILPGICALVEKWELGGDFPQVVTPETFPYLPRKSSNLLIIALINAINEIIIEEDDLPLP